MIYLVLYDLPVPVAYHGLSLDRHVSKNTTDVFVKCKPENGLSLDINLDVDTTNTVYSVEPTYQLKQVSKAKCSHIISLVGHCCTKEKDSRQSYVDCILSIL